MTLSVYLTLFFMLGYLFLQQVWVYVLAFSYNENEAVFLFAKCETILMKTSLIYLKMNLQAEVISI